MPVRPRGMRHRVRDLLVAASAMLLTVGAAFAQTDTRLTRIQHRGTLGCGVEPAVPGFAEVDRDGRYRGLDVDVCRAIAAAILGSGDRVTFIPVLNVAELERRDDIDVVARRLTWELRRERPLGLLFGPVTFYDGQAFLVARALGVPTARRLADVDLCVAGGTVFEVNAGAFFGTHRKVVLASPHDYADIANALSTGRCRAYTGDESDLGAIRSRLPTPADWVILPDRISKEPLAPLVRQEDLSLFNVVRWTIFALITAEELGVTSSNATAMTTSTNLEVQRLLGVVPGNGRALGLRERWALDAIASVGNYGEMFDRNVGKNSPIKLERGLNRLAGDGGLMFAPPLR